MGMVSIQLTNIYTADGSYGHEQFAPQISMVSCQKGPTRHASAWQLGPFWDTLDISLRKSSAKSIWEANVKFNHHLTTLWVVCIL